jgi:hypothetical protein
VATINLRWPFDMIDDQFRASRFTGLKGEPGNIDRVMVHTIRTSLPCIRRQSLVSRLIVFDLTE